MYGLIEKKKNSKKLTRDEIYYIVNGYTSGEIPDYQMSAFLMAVCLNGMDDEETYNFTMAMKESGEELDLSRVEGAVVDKHSTGGVGDKVSLVMGPMVAACGVPVAKMSGRGLGHTGGTIDKLESFAGFDTSPDEDTFIKNVNDIGISWAGQTANLAPADKKIYALRDVTATVDSMPLIASSIMSKKLASGAEGIVLDVTYGSGAFMRTPDEAKRLAELMMKIGRMNGKKMSAVITDMDEPLGTAVGNSLEVIEAIEVLKGGGPKSVLEVAITLGSHMLMLNGKCPNQDTGKLLLMETIESGAALDKMAQWVERQGGNPKQVYNTDLFEKAQIEKKLMYKGEVCRYVNGIDGKEIGMAVTALGGGRTKKDEKIDLSVGIKLMKKTGDKVMPGEAYCIIYGNQQEKIDDAIGLVQEAYEFSDRRSMSKIAIFDEIW